MTRKHFQAIAETISEIENTYERENVALKFAKMLPQFNGHFDRQKFLEACGVEGLPK
mgnify:FL=1|tara:strand:- start:21 stop:191 length:171 start_codon:yes stop_codon:yes gene_type:complete